MPESFSVTVEAVPSMWRVLLYRIAQAEKRALIMGDWETNVFGYRCAMTGHAAAALPRSNSESLGPRSAHLLRYARVMADEVLDIAHQRNHSVPRSSLVRWEIPLHRPVRPPYSPRRRQSATSGSMR